VIVTEIGIEIVFSKRAPRRISHDILACRCIEAPSEGASVIVFLL
jgi:hypothetical protein